jgi:hypothetical protein
MKHELSNDAENVAIQFDKLKELSLEEKLKIIQENYLTQGCDGAHVNNLDLCSYEHGCSYKLNKSCGYDHCMKEFKEE